MKFHLFIIFVVCCFRVSGQGTALASARCPNKAYLGVDNPLSVFIREYSCSSLFVTTDNGSVESVGGCCYNFRAVRPGEAYLNVYHKQNGKSKKIKTFHWYVFPIPKPIAQVGPYENGSNVQRGAFCAQSGVAAFTPGGLGFDLTFRVIGFSFIIMRDSAIQFNTRVIGNMFNTSIDEACKMLQPGSVVLIADIQAIGAYGKAIYLDPLEYRIL